MHECVCVCVQQVYSYENKWQYLDRHQFLYSVMHAHNVMHECVCVFVQQIS